MIKQNPGHTTGMLIGVTGGIASGKSTVAKMLEELGAVLIDFDVLAREIVEPEKPAWRDIVAFFGQQVLNEDRTLDRKGLSHIVFQDKKKRKKLESFTHPRIHEVFKGRVKSVMDKNPCAIIQAVIPLLIEANLQDKFHKILLIYVPREVQIKRLVARDNITEDDATRRLDAQLPIDDKIEYADFVVHNENSLEDTRLQVQKLWKELKKHQNERVKSASYIECGFPGQAGK